MSTGREGHRVLAEPLNSLKYNQPLSLLGQLPGRAETLLSPSWGSLHQGQEAWCTNWLQVGGRTAAWRGATLSSHPKPQGEELPEAGESGASPSCSDPTAAFSQSQQARGHSC